MCYQIVVIYCVMRVYFVFLNVEWVVFDCCEVNVLILFCVIVVYCYDCVVFVVQGGGFECGWVFMFIYFDGFIDEGVIFFLGCDVLFMYFSGFQGDVVFYYIGIYGLMVDCCFIFCGDVLFYVFVQFVKYVCVLLGYWGEVQVFIVQVVVVEGVQ